MQSTEGKKSRKIFIKILPILTKKFLFKFLYRNNGEIGYNSFKTIALLNKNNLIPYIWTHRTIYFLHRGVWLAEWLMLNFDGKLDTAVSSPANSNLKVSTHLPIVFFPKVKPSIHNKADNTVFSSRFQLKTE